MPRCVEVAARLRARLRDDRATAPTKKLSPRASARLRAPSMNSEVVRGDEQRCDDQADDGEPVVVPGGPALGDLLTGVAAVCDGS